MRNDRLKKYVVGLGLGVLMLTVTVSAIAAARRTHDRPSPADTWTSAVADTDSALASGDLTGALVAWHRGYAAALQDRSRWDGLIEVGDARLRIAQTSRVDSAGTAKARELYLAALFRARHHRSAEGVLRAGAAFEALGDHEVAAQAARMAAKL